MSILTFLLEGASTSMRWFLVLLIWSFGMCAPSLRAADPIKDSGMPPSESPLLPWTNDFDKAIATAKSDRLPIYLYFTGSSWCIWCKKMDREIHNQDAFRQKTVGKLHFVKIDLPAGTQPPEKIKSLLDTYHIQGVPTVVILSPDGQELARFRYQQISPDQYADAVLEATTLPAPKEN